MVYIQGGIPGYTQGGVYRAIPQGVPHAPIPQGVPHAPIPQGVYRAVCTGCVPGCMYGMCTGLYVRGVYLPGCTSRVCTYRGVLLGCVFPEVYCWFKAGFIRSLNLFYSLGCLRFIRSMMQE